MEGSLIWSFYCIYFLIWLSATLWWKNKLTFGHNFPTFLYSSGKFSKFPARLTFDWSIIEIWKWTSQYLVGFELIFCLNIVFADFGRLKKSWKISRKERIRRALSLVPWVPMVPFESSSCSGMVAVLFMVVVVIVVVEVVVRVVVDVVVISRGKLYWLLYLVQLWLYSKEWSKYPVICRN